MLGGSTHVAPRASGAAPGTRGPGKFRAPRAHLRAVRASDVCGPRCRGLVGWPVAAAPSPRTRGSGAGASGRHRARWLRGVVCSERVALACPQGGRRRLRSPVRKRNASGEPPAPPRGPAVPAQTRTAVAARHRRTWAGGEAPAVRELRGRGFTPGAACAPGGSPSLILRPAAHETARRGPSARRERAASPRSGPRVCARACARGRHRVPAGAQPGPSRWPRAPSARPSARPLAPVALRLLAGHRDPQCSGRTSLVLHVTNQREHVALTFEVFGVRIKHPLSRAPLRGCLAVRLSFRSFAC